MAAKIRKGIIAILTGGGDVPGLNPAIRAVTIRALREGYQVIGLRRGWAGIMEVIRDKKADNSQNYRILTEDIVNKSVKEGLDAIAITDHNSGAWIDLIKSAAKNRLVVFPGVEITTTAGERSIHIVAVFDKDESSKGIAL